MKKVREINIAVYREIFTDIDDAFEWISDRESEGYILCRFDIRTFSDMVVVEMINYNDIIKKEGK